MEEETVSSPSKCQPYQMHRRSVQFFLERNKIRFLPKVFIEMSDVFLLDCLYLAEALKKVERAKVESMKLEVCNYSSPFFDFVLNFLCNG